MKIKEIIKESRKAIHEEHDLITIADIDLSGNASDEDIDLFDKQVRGISRGLSADENMLMGYIDWDREYQPEDAGAELVKTTKFYDIFSIIVDGERILFARTTKGSPMVWLWFASDEDAEKYLSYVEKEILGYEK